MTCRVEDVPDDFYEFGPGDYVAVMQGYSHSKAQAEVGLRTAKLRQQEETKKASRFPQTTIRIVFPDTHILQVSPTPPPLPPSPPSHAIPDPVGREPSRSSNTTLICSNIDQQSGMIVSGCSLSCGRLICTPTCNGLALHRPPPPPPGAALLSCSFWLVNWLAAGPWGISI